MIRFFGDYHTHTKYSDGFDTVENNVKAAISKELLEVAITDHGYRNTFCLTRKSVKKQRLEIEECRLKYTNIKILHGIEANLIGGDGLIDLHDDELDYFDIIIAGYHPTVIPYRIKDFYEVNFKTYLSSIFKPSKDQIKRNTKTAIDMIKKYDIDVYPHPNNLFIIDIKEVAKACYDFGTYLELNLKHKDLKIYDEIIDSVACVVANTDAHIASRVGDLTIISEYLKENNIPESRISNAVGPLRLRSKET